MQVQYENVVNYNLSESGILPLKLSELLDGQGDTEIFLNQDLCYPEADGYAEDAISAIDIAFRLVDAPAYQTTNLRMSQNKQ